MKRKYGDDQRLAVKNIRENLIKELELVYSQAFDQLNDMGLGEGFIAKTTQLILLSRNGAIDPLKREIESKHNFS